jgi:hypothetical protein
MDWTPDSLRVGRGEYALDACQGRVKWEGHIMFSPKPNLNSGNHVCRMPHTRRCRGPIMTTRGAKSLTRAK